MKLKEFQKLVEITSIPVFKKIGERNSPELNISLTSFIEYTYCLVVDRSHAGISCPHSPSSSIQYSSGHVSPSSKLTFIV